jgi:hypothetical protein
MVSVVCWNCEKVRELGPVEEIEPSCNIFCKDAFHDIVDRLTAGESFEDVGVPANSLTGRRAVEVVLTERRAERIERREWREWEYAQSRPRKLRPLYPC